MTTATTTTRKATKTEQAETAVKITARDQKSLDLLVTAAREGVERYTKLLKDAEQLTADANTTKVYTARAVGKLMDHPAVIAKRGPKAGTPARTVIAGLLGIPAATLFPVFQAADELRKNSTDGKPWHLRTGKPSPAELDIVARKMKAVAVKRNANRTGTSKGKGTTTKPGTNTKVNYAVIETSLKSVLDTVTKFTKDAGFSETEAEALQTYLDLIHDAVETATAAPASK